MNEHLVDWSPINFIFERKKKLSWWKFKVKSNINSKKKKIWVFCIFTWMFRSEFNSVCSQFNIFCIQGREKPKNWSAVRDSSTVSQPHREVKVEKRCWRVFWGFYEIYCLFTGDHKPVKKKELWHTSFFINISAPLRFFGSSSAARIKR